ncbi:hypothetical protein HDU82_005157 [Entophlyctis luteolus]|nr:hypothetical protein HDU82_005157 [Entophlyctis luteolus]
MPPLEPLEAAAAETAAAAAELAVLKEDAAEAETAFDVIAATAAAVVFATTVTVEQHDSAATVVALQNAEASAAVWKPDLRKLAASDERLTMHVVAVDITPSRPEYSDVSVCATSLSPDGQNFALLKVDVHDDSNLFHVVRHSGADAAVEQVALVESATVVMPEAIKYMHQDDL